MAGDDKTNSATVRDFLERGRDRLALQLVAGESGLGRVIGEPAINRPGLGLAGFYKFFPEKRIQLIGYAEFAYLRSLDPAMAEQRLRDLFAHRVPCVIYARNRRPSKSVQELADRYSVPLLRTEMITGQFTNAATILMEDLIVPRMRIHGTMMEVSGMGVIIEGEAGIGKSETALGLIKHGHALVADDCTELRPSEGGAKLVGNAVDATRYFMEIRGLGIIYVPSIFGAAAVRGEKQVDLVVTLKRESDAGAELDRVGENTLSREFLGVKVPQVIIPVAPGRDLVNVVETVAQEYKLRFSGQVAYMDLDERLRKNAAKKRI